jgi:hypothetical protein
MVIKTYLKLAVSILEPTVLAPPAFGSKWQTDRGSVVLFHSTTILCMLGVTV